MIRDPIPGPAGRTRGPRLISTGEQASAVAANILPTAHSITWSGIGGEVELRPGAIWNGREMLVYASPINVYYTVGDQLYESETGSFVGEKWPNALGQVAAHETATIYLAEAEMALLRSFFVPWYSILSMDAARVGLFYAGNHALMDTALRYCPTVLYLLIGCQQRYPKLFCRLPVTTNAGYILNATGAPFYPYGVAAFMAHVLRGGRPSSTLGAVLRLARAVAGIVEKLAETLRALFIFAAVWQILKIILWFTMPPVAAAMPSVNYDDLKKKAMEGFAKTLIGCLAEEGDDRLSESDAVAILEELISDPHTVSKMQQLEAALTRLVPVMDQLKAAIPS